MSSRGSRKQRAKAAEEQSRRLSDLQWELTQAKLETEAMRIERDRALALLHDAHEERFGPWVAGVASNRAKVLDLIEAIGCQCSPRQSPLLQPHDRTCRIATAMRAFGGEEEAQRQLEQAWGWALWMNGPLAIPGRGMSIDWGRGDDQAVRFFGTHGVTVRSSELLMHGQLMQWPAPLNEGAATPEASPEVRTVGARDQDTPPDVA